MKNIEQELKLALTEREYNLLLKDAGDGGVLQSNYYFSCSAMPSTDMLRIRKKDGEFELCLKRLLTGKANVWVSNEFSSKIDRKQFEYFFAHGITTAELADLIGLDLTDEYLDTQTLPHLSAPNLTFFCCGKFETFRTKFLLAGFNVELDKNSYFDTVDYELECECTDVLKFNALTSYLQYHYGIVICPSKPKSQRFFDKLEGV